MMQMTPVVKQLLIINILFYIGSQIVPGAYDFLSLYYFESNSFQFWQPLTHMFMHAKYPNITHIVFNMFALYSFGSALEHFWGAKKFVFFYISCGLGAALLQTGVTYFEIQYLLKGAEHMQLSGSDMHQIFNIDFVTDGYFNKQVFLQKLEPILAASGKTAALNQAAFDSLYSAAATSNVTMVGASGAIYGLLVAFAFMFPNAELFMIFIPIPIKAKYFVPGMLALDLFSGISSSSIIGGPSTGTAHFAHIGGALFGFVMMWYWRKNQFKHNRWN